MSGRHTSCSALCLFLAGLLMATGCAMVESTHTFLKENFNDRPDPTDQSDESWVKKAGEEGRGNRQRETDPDFWFNRWFKSEKHREIERNLGVDQGF